ncbi:MAG: DNA-3-methyladenine glycosylase I [Candidatus Aminicenantes bacterium]|nr:DNA-3-methyladenine glycosylase I [Candidatus Aminicenantes bacterium]
MRTVEERDRILALIIKSVEENAKTQPDLATPTSKIYQDDKEIFLKICELIAYQGVRASVVTEIIKKGLLEKALANGDFNEVAEWTPEKFEKYFWEEIKDIRFPAKLEKMIGVARAMQKIVQEHGSFHNFLKNFNLPEELKSISDVDKFWHWDGVEKVREGFESYGMPGLKNYRTLMHFLENMGYPCLKPDRIVMRVMHNVGLVEKETGKKHLRQAVRTIQEYCVGKDITPKIMDRFLLMFGGQSDFKDSMNRTFCYSSDKCDITDCEIRRQGYCVIAR